MWVYHKTIGTTVAECFAIEAPPFDKRSTELTPKSQGAQDVASFASYSAQDVAGTEICYKATTKGVTCPMPARVLHALVSLFAETVRGWSHRNPDLLSAALAFNTLFSLAPLLLLFITIAGEQYRSQVVGQIFGAVDRWGGPAIAGLVAELLAGMQRASAGPLLTLVTAIILAWSASGMVLRLRFALNTMWDLVPVEAPNVGRGVLVTLTGRLISVGILLVIGFALLALLILNTLATTLFSIQLQALIPRLGEAASPVPPGSLSYCTFSSSQSPSSCCPRATSAGGISGPARC